MGLLMVVFCRINVSTPPKGNDDPGRARADKTQNRYIIETS